MCNSDKFFPWTIFIPWMVILILAIFFDTPKPTCITLPTDHWQCWDHL